MAIPIFYCHQILLLAELLRDKAEDKIFHELYLWLPTGLPFGQEDDDEGQVHAGVRTLCTSAVDSSAMEPSHHQPKKAACRKPSKYLTPEEAIGNRSPVSKRRSVQQQDAGAALALHGCHLKPSTTGSRRPSSQVESKAAARGPEEPWNRPALPKTGRKSPRTEAQAVAAGTSPKVGVSGSPHLKRREQKATKGVETPWLFPMPAAEVPRKSLLPPDSGHEVARHSPKPTATASRKPAKCTPQRAVPESPSPHTRRSSKQRSPLDQEAIPATTHWPAVSKRKLTQPPLTPEEAKDNRKEPAVGVLQTAGPLHETGRANLIALSPEAAGGGGAILPRKSALALHLRGHHANVRKPTLASQLAALKSRRSRAVSFPAKPVYIKEKTRSALLIDDAEPRWQPLHYDGVTGWEPVRRQPPEVAISDDILADLRGMTKLAASQRFDPFRPHSKFEVGSAAGGGTGTPTIASMKYKKKRMSSVPGFKYPVAPAPKLNLVFPEREQSLAMERVAGMCVLVVTAAAVLFLVYYMLRADDTNRLSTYASPTYVPEVYHEHTDHDANSSLLLFPLQPETEWDPRELAGYRSVDGIAHKFQDTAVEPVGNCNTSANCVNSGSYAALQN